MNNIEIIDYNYSHWAHCNMTVEILFNGKKYTLNDFSSGGHVSWGPEGDEIYKGPWTVDLDDYPELKEYEEEITEVINKEIPWGCCGGCI